MGFSPSILTLLYSTTVLVCTPIGLCCLFKKRSFGFNLLGTFFLLFAASVFGLALHTEGFFNKQPEALFLPIFLTLLTPFLLGAAYFVLEESPEKWKRWVLVPVTFEVLVLTSLYFFPESAKMRIVQSDSWRVSIGSFQTILNLIFVFQIFKLWNSSRHGVREYKDAAIPKKLDFIFLLGVLYCSLIFFEFLKILPFSDFLSKLGQYAAAVVSVGIAGCAFWVKKLKSNEITHHGKIDNGPNLIPDFGEGHESEELKAFRKINALIEREKLFRNPDLTLGLLAGELNMSQRKLSELIKKCTGMNFNRFINAHRVTQAMEYLSDSQNDALSVVSIGLESGFNSRASFFSEFKSFTRVSPAEFRRLRKRKTSDKKPSY